MTVHTDLDVDFKIVIDEFGHYSPALIEGAKVGYAWAKTGRPKEARPFAHQYGYRIGSAERDAWELGFIEAYDLAQHELLMKR